MLAYSVWITLIMLGTCITETMAVHANEFPLPVSSHARRNSNLTVNQTGVLAMSWVSPLASGYQIGVATSSDGGLEWKVVDSVHTMRAFLLGLQRRPTVQVLSNGHLVCAFLDTKLHDAMPRVYVTRSTNAGTTWSDAVAVVEGFQADMQDFSDMAQSSTGELAISFISADSIDAGTHIYVVRSTDGGVTWTRALRANKQGWQGNACECCMTCVRYAPNGMLGVAFRANRNNVRDVHLALLPPGKAEFDDPILIQNQPWNISGCPATGPTLAFDQNSTAHVSWRDYRDAVQRPVVYVARYQYADPQPPANLDITTNFVDDAEYPSIGVSADGNVFIVLHEASDGIRAVTGRYDMGVASSTVVDSAVNSSANTAVVRLVSGEMVGVLTTRRMERTDVAMIRWGPVSVNHQSTVPVIHMSNSIVVPSGMRALVVSVLGEVLRTIEPTAESIHLLNVWHQPVYVITSGSGYRQLMLLLR